MKSYEEQIAALKARIVIDTGELRRIEKLIADDGVPPQYQKLIGASWPFAKGSISRASFKLALQGVTVDELKEQVDALGYDFKVVLSVLRRGKTATHSWVLIEKDGNLALRHIKALR